MLMIIWNLSVITEAEQDKKQEEKEALNEEANQDK